MPGYVAKALERFSHPTPAQAQQYGASTQLTAPIGTSPLLDKDGITRIKWIISIFLYCAHTVDFTLLVALGSLAATQAKVTQLANTTVSQLRDYAATHPDCDAVVCFCSSAMILSIHSDASYLSETKACSCTGGLFFLSKPPTSLALGTVTPPLNGAIHVNSNTLPVIFAFYH
jgi:hypothetical protein